MRFVIIALGVGLSYGCKSRSYATLKSDPATAAPGGTDDASHIMNYVCSFWSDSGQIDKPFLLDDRNRTPQVLEMKQDGLVAHIGVTGVDYVPGGLSVDLTIGIDDPTGTLLAHAQFDLAGHNRFMTVSKDLGPPMFWCKI
jgi:hypothetical protein